MNVLIVLLFFLLCPLVVYLGMRTVCFLKKQYWATETFLVKVIEFFECEDCKKSCDDHRRMVRRAIAWGLLIWAVGTAAYCVAIWQ